MTKTIWIVRHAERIDHANPTWLQTSDRPWDPHITEVGKKQARETALVIREMGTVDAIITSPFLRCIETASIISNILQNPPVCLDTALSEFMTPKYFSEQPTYLSVPQIMRICPNFEMDYQPCGVANFPETPQQFVRRLQKIAKRIRLMEAETIVLVTHGYGVGVLANIFEPNVTVKKADYCCLSRFVLDGTTKKYRVDLLSDSSHWKKKLISQNELLDDAEVD